MRKLILGLALGMSVTLAFMSPSFAQAADPTMNQIYDAAAAGHLDQAQQMISQVLVDRPNSAKAHYVQAELYAKEGKTSLARAELGTAERLNPGLTSFSPRSVAELKSQLGLSSRGGQIVSVPQRSATHFPWGTVLILAVVVGVLMMLFRRRTPYNQYPAAGPGPAPGMGGAPGGYGPGYGPAPMGGGGLGSGIAGGLASGLAVGAGVVAGEELAHHFLDGGRRDGGVIPSAEASEPGSSNSDMGGADFGANDPGSWDDGGGFGGGGGGDDWS
ncbi:MAG: tetratricopeptide repeat protein [Pseudomonadota bacterium]|nr:tetratricopeptide repeat protein [Pseudomonadota bacterium]